MMPFGKSSLRSRTVWEFKYQRSGKRPDRPFLILIQPRERNGVDRRANNRSGFSFIREMNRQT